MKCELIVAPPTDGQVCAMMYGNAIPSAKNNNHAPHVYAAVLALGYERQRARPLPQLFQDVRLTARLHGQRDLAVHMGCGRLLPLSTIGGTKNLDGFYLEDDFRMFQEDSEDFEDTARHFVQRGRDLAIELEDAGVSRRQAEGFLPGLTDCMWTWTVSINDLAAYAKPVKDVVPKDHPDVRDAYHWAWQEFAKTCPSLTQAFQETWTQ